MVVKRGSERVFASRSFVNASRDPAKFDEFATRYREELKVDDHAAAYAQLEAMAAVGALTLLTAAKRDDISEAAVLAHLLRHREAEWPSSSRG